MYSKTAEKSGYFSEEG